MNPKTRKTIRVMPEENSELVQAKFDLLLGSNLTGRKEHIAHNGSKYADLVDLS